MSHQDGTYLGGIRSVEDIRQRCRIDCVTGCWHWSMAFVQGSPKIHFVDANGNRQSGRGRRVVLKLAGRIKPGQTAFAAPHCRAADCVNPDHCTAGTRAAAGRAITASGVWKSHPAKLAAAKASAARRRVLTDEQRAEIRQRTESNVKLAAEYNVSREAIRTARNGYRTDGMSVFNPPSWRTS